MPLRVLSACSPPRAWVPRAPASLRSAMVVRQRMVALVRGRHERRRSARERRIALLEQRWLDLTAMTDEQVVGLAPRD